jgi:hypothetical protein
MTSRSGSCRSRTGTVRFLVLILLATSSTATVRGGEGDGVAEVKRIVLQHAEGVEQRNLALLDSIWSHDERVPIFEGVHANFGWEDYRDRQLKPKLERMRNVKYRLSDINPNIEGKIAWVTFQYSISADFRGRRSHMDEKGLGTAILERRDEGWRIVHWHASAP